MCLSVRTVFFFQAEDGIRDYKVTGVQTCALPIFRAFEHANVGERRDHVGVHLRGMRAVDRLAAAVLLLHPVVDVLDRKSTRLNSSHLVISYAVFCLKQKTRASSTAGIVGALAVAT